MQSVSYSLFIYKRLLVFTWHFSLKLLSALSITNLLLASLPSLYNTWHLPSNAFAHYKTQAWPIFWWWRRIELEREVTSFLYNFLSNFLFLTHFSAAVHLTASKHWQKPMLPKIMEIPSRLSFRDAMFEKMMFAVCHLCLCAITNRVWWTLLYYHSRFIYLLSTLGFSTEVKCTWKG